MFKTVRTGSMKNKTTTHKSFNWTKKNCRVTDWKITLQNNLMWTGFFKQPAIALVRYKKMLNFIFAGVLKGQQYWNHKQRLRSFAWYMYIYSQNIASFSLCGAAMRFVGICSLDR